MSATAVGDGSPKLHKKPKKSKSVMSHANPGNADEVRAKPKGKRHQEATKNVLPLDHKDQASATQDSNAYDHSSPLDASSADSGNVASKNAQLADSATSYSGRPPKEEKERHLGDPVRDQSKGASRSDEHKEEDQVRSGDMVHGQSKDASKDDESRKEKKTKKKKRSDEGKEEGAAESDNTKVQTMEEAASDKSRQKKRKSSAEEQSEDTPAADKSRKKKKRRHTTDTVFPDPSADESLSDQSQKALSYAYSRFQHLPHWKFNKAKQIWLVKQLWSEEMIPEKYFSLVVKYLADGEGRIRLTLVQMCNSAIASVTADASVASATGLTDPSNGGSATTTKVTRARSLLDALSCVQ
ncbi:hypothetical protein K503DRAFT_868344 [Rhizopogon vinicolor AM-OR11-026]|uniref:WKF domain-containing protein n=1 Tax=Rhizopogon vinicolor AM-OR11-026 TaxID=1314800 RepID=A0A1B7MRW1_9AGAM|nr:hypothetical protein K503DRAFT_868344 [Rhizopogon vinicolor AM-OR11-026]